MEKRRSRIRWAVILAALGGVLICGQMHKGIDALAAAAAEGQPDLQRSDLIEIDSMAAYGKLEKPVVPFLHDAHTEALAKNNKDCITCHPRENDRLSPRFKRSLSGPEAKKDLMNLYHDSCLGCHQEMASLGQETGPAEECGFCHIAEPSVRSNWERISLDRSLHFRHADRLTNKCENCHHQYDEEKKALVYIKDKEGSCQYCHGTESVNNRVSMRLASHAACIGCHREMRSQQLTAGPVQCAGCHDPERQKLIRKVSPVPRLNVNQPDTVYIKKDNKDPYMAIDSYLDPKMARVRFDHKRHESSGDTCRACHHADLSSCNSCHTLAGLKAGADITIERAMHQYDSEHSCVGCHATQTRHTECAGCHTLMPSSKAKAANNCQRCHNGPAPGAETPQLTPAELTMSDADTSAASFESLTYPPDFPEKIEIGAIASSYGAVDFPHRRIIDAIWKKIRDSRLAAAFHGGTEALCQGCHHNSPASEKPPRCGNCHGKPFDENDPGRPGLMGAYHMQCMGCHEAMNIEKPAAADCAGCHEEKKAKPNA